MGKKGKKKAKITGTPEVQKFKQTREFCLLKECITIQESLPFVELDPLDEPSIKRIARFLNMIGLLAEHLQLHSKKEGQFNYRFNYHHKYLAPTPQFFPFGYDVNVITQARYVRENANISFNGEEYALPEEIRTASENFLKDVDHYMNRIGSIIEPRMTDDFATGLKRFKSDLKEELEKFDEDWVKFESEYVKVRHDILNKAMLTQAEERLDIEGKQRLEGELVWAAEALANELFQETKQDMFPDDVIPLAEACIFYESKVTEEWLHLCRHLIKDYLELRAYISKIPEVRLFAELAKNADMCRLLKNRCAYGFCRAASGQEESRLDSLTEALPWMPGAWWTTVALPMDANCGRFVATLPALIHAKTSDWMTKALLAPDLQYIQNSAALAREAAG
ncbi:unnamed protein product [Prorocentrum cordatum]|uniref:Uncharacterized protein n=1 Tax=Prorocentrum cordatum TaxID=2364126 RepID=A0ABN9UW36_9DINO|nr:unnamed protein product [Polarella glacialis]